MFDHVIFLNTTSFIVLQVIGSVKHLFMASKIIVFILDWLRRVFFGDWEILSSLFI